MFVRVIGLTKTFELSPMDMTISLGRALLGLGRREQLVKRSVTAVDNVSVEVKEGERIGIIGRNGAGKTTLLQMIAGLAAPTSGKVEVEGRVNCVMTLGVGLREELTGRENVYVDGALNGKSRDQVDDVIAEVVDFAELGEFIDRPLRTYSTGMKARLAFAMITVLEPEVLIIDEALSVGDAMFSLKATAKIRELCQKGRIVIIVSHSMSAIVDMCDRCLWMDGGRLVQDGPPEQVTQAYLNAVREADEKDMQEQFRQRIGNRTLADGFSVRDLSFLDASGQQRLIFNIGEELTVHFSAAASSDLVQPDFRLSVERTDGILLLENYASEDGFQVERFRGEAAFEIPMGPLFLGKGCYEICLELLDHARPDPVLASADTVLRIEDPSGRMANAAFQTSVEWDVTHVSGKRMG